MSDSPDLLVPDTKPTPRLRPFSDILADDCKNLEVIEEYARRVKRDGPLQPKSRVSLHGYLVNPQEEEVLQTRFSTLCPRLLEPHRTRSPITWSHVMLESLKPSDFIPKENGFYECQVQGALIQMTRQDMDEVLSELGICRRVITEPYSIAAERETREKVAGHMIEQMNILVKRYKVCQSIFRIVNGSSKSNTIRAEVLPTPATSATDARQISPDAAQESRSVTSACLSPKRPASLVPAEVLDKRPRRSEHEMDVRPDNHSASQRESVSDTESDDSSSDNESTGGDIPYNSEKQSDTVNSGSPNADVRQMEEPVAIEFVAERRVSHHTWPARRGCSYSTRENREAQKFLINHVQLGYTTSQIEAAYKRHFNATRSVRILLKRFCLGHLRSLLSENELREKAEVQD